MAYFCVLCGLYEKLVNSVLNFFKDVKKNFTFLFPICLGIFVGIFLFGNVLKFLFNKYYMPTSFIFIGLILGSIPLIVKQANLKKVNFSHIICMLLTFSFSLYLVALEDNITNSLNINCNSYLILAGVITSAGIIIPGVSKTVILMLLGIYEIYLSAIASLNLSILIPIGIGFLIGGIIFLFLMNFLFKIAKSYTYFAIIGFILGSIFVVYPGFSFNLEGVISIILFAISFILAYKLSS
ncbi:MAG: undecaprenyl phosphate translocase family protein [Clostridia bacterium]